MHDKSTNVSLQNETFLTSVRTQNWSKWNHVTRHKAIILAQTEREHKISEQIKKEHIFL